VHEKPAPGTQAAIGETWHRYRFANFLQIVPGRTGGDRIEFSSLTPCRHTSSPPMSTLRPLPRRFHVRPGGYPLRIAGLCPSSSPRYSWATRPTAPLYRGQAQARPGVSRLPAAPRTCALVRSPAPCPPRPRRSAAPCSRQRL
jgi:hypothetical protein